MKKTVLTVFILTIFASIAIADQDTLYPTDDADVWQDMPDTNRGASQHFQVGRISSDYRNSCIKFDLSSYSGMTINNATIRLMVIASWGDFPTDQIYIARNSADWDELSITWNNKPGFAAVMGITAPSILFDWWEIDVTGWIQGIVDGTYPNYGFQIYQADTDYAGVTSRTKEGTISPELVLEYIPASLESTTFGRIKSLFLY